MNGENINKIKVETQMENGNRTGTRVRSYLVGLHKFVLLLKQK